MVVCMTLAAISMTASLLWMIVVQIEQANKKK